MFQTLFILLYLQKDVQQFYGEIQRKLEAATAMKLSSKDLLDLRVIDEIIEEPLGGAQR